MALDSKIEQAGKLLEAAKNFFIDLFRPDMTLEKIADVVSPRLDDTIKKYESRGLKYSAGKFSVKYVDEKHFNLEFEMYFQDEEGKWHKCANESEPRDSTLLEDGAWKTIQALKVITFPIEKPKAPGENVLQQDQKLEEYNAAERERYLNEPFEGVADTTAESVSADEKTADKPADETEKK
ncbi:MAG: hypothetical protein IJ685_12820 [Selenomonadaceae bacterium]|nr:hypothetical protein [Selenomonadaceae bacterium]